ncbi:MAG: hypothetical protein WDM70_04815 [Nitrosomonadales bacterium]
MKYVTVRTIQHEYLIEEALTALEKEFAATFHPHPPQLPGSEKCDRKFCKVTDDEDCESHWTVKLKGLDEMLPISRRQQSIVKEFCHT